MAVHLDTLEAEQHWDEEPQLDMSEIYTESFLTSKILEFLVEEKSTTDLIEELKKQINSNKLSISEKTETLIALIALGDFDFVIVITKEEDEAFIKNFRNRTEQLISTFKEPIARWSSKIAEYLLEPHNIMKVNQSKYNLQLKDYCKIYLSLMANSGGLPIVTYILAEAVDNVEAKYKLCVEYFACKFTHACDLEIFRRKSAFDHKNFILSPGYIGVHPQALHVFP
ncbi:unnamed protein product [Didymodactylos carnosus]|uniref:Uncharacterized protein n=1 Tax=Didymodactylos carnosus TaxID=1234261 RepID=A0A816ABR0_9BILA|nr:unnamed protein product [Didymodactylos carnosus]CAF1595998.1 unnamed protein product [Didymodactylos carnosus]CAF3507807.1 unnamed protein product [Didymodactylos carnosus]CAF4470699.1 unnamed protein product [Didymodactylos carnosus]